MHRLIHPLVLSVPLLSALSLPSLAFAEPRAPRAQEQARADKEQRLNAYKGPTRTYQSMGVDQGIVRHISGARELIMGGGKRLVFLPGGQHVERNAKGQFAKPEAPGMRFNDDVEDSRKGTLTPWDRRPAAKPGDRTRTWEGRNGDWRSSGTTTTSTDGSKVTTWDAHNVVTGARLQGEKEHAANGGRFLNVTTFNRNGNMTGGFVHAKGAQN